MKFNGAIFDLDGTLLDSMPIWETVARDYLISKNKVPRPDLREKLRPLSLSQSAEYFQKEYGVAATTQQIVDGVNDLLNHFYLHKAPAKEGVADFLEALRQRGVKMCVATATHTHLVKAALSRTGLLPYFSAIFTCPDVGKSKDEPEIFLRALAHLGTEMQETYVFEDALFAMQTAQRAGFPIAAIYDLSAQGQQEQIKQLANVYCESFVQMKELLL